MDNHPLSGIFRRRLREVRDGRRMTRVELSARLDEIGHPIDALTIARIENGRAKRVHLDDVVALAYALDVSPLFLLLPYGKGETVPVDGLEIPVYDDLVTIASGLDPIDHYALRSWLRARSRCEVRTQQTSTARCHQTSSRG